MCAQQELGWSGCEDGEGPGLPQTSIFLAQEMKAEQRSAIFLPFQALREELQPHLTLHRELCLGTDVGTRLSPSPQGMRTMRRAWSWPMTLPKAL